MAEKSDQEKTEEPSEKRVEEFRSEGRIARSVELSSLITLAAGFVSLFAIRGVLGDRILFSFRDALSFDGNPDTHSFITWVFTDLVPVMYWIGVLFAIILVCAVCGSLAQTGLVFSSKRILPRFDGLSPAQGIKKIFSQKALVQFIKNFSKVLVIGWIAYVFLNGHRGEIISSHELNLQQGIAWAVHLIAMVLMRIFLFLLVLSGSDYLYQWWTIHQEMKMSRQELKDEMKEREVSPEVKNKVRRVSMERAKRQIQRDVPLADVIVTNPTHYAVALRYERLKDPAPRVVAKGKDHLAAVIRALAQENEVPLYEYPELARNLYSKVKVGKTIPAELYPTVARVLAYIYQIYQKRYQKKGEIRYVG